jgi:hypothetical protein
MPNGRFTKVTGDGMHVEEPDGTLGLGVHEKLDGGYHIVYCQLGIESEKQRIRLGREY